MLKQQKIAEALNKELEKLAQDYKVSVNKDYFERKKKTTAPEPEMVAQQEMPTRAAAPMKAM